MWICDHLIGEVGAGALLFFGLCHVYGLSWFVCSSSWCHKKAMFCECNSSCMSFILCSDSFPRTFYLVFPGK